MSTLNPTSHSLAPCQHELLARADGGHRNWMDGISFFHADPLARLRMAAASSFFGEPQYYSSASRAPLPVATASDVLKTRQRTHIRETLRAVGPEEWIGLGARAVMERAIDAALAFDAEGTLRLAVELRGRDHIRATPQVIMVRAAHHPEVRGTGLVGRYASQILQRADEPAAQLAYHNSAYGAATPIPNALKKAWRRYLAQLPDYAVAKYRQDARAVKMRDVVNVCHPRSAALDKLMKGTLTLEERTWESLISAKGSTPEAWGEALERFLLNPKGHMALLRNLRNLHQAGLLDQRVLDALKAGALEGRQLPFRYYAAYRQLQVEGVAGPVLDAVESCLMASLDTLPRFHGRVMSLSDNSGSARGATTSEMGTMQVSTIGNLSAILTGMVADEGWVGVFGDQLERLPIRRGSSVFDQLDKAEALADEVGQRTEHGIWLFFEQALRKKEHWDHIFVYSDQQAGHGGLYGEDPEAYSAYRFPHLGDNDYIDVAKLVAAYREQVNPNVMVYLVQTAGYHDALMPEFYDRTYILGGWGPGLLKFAHAMSALSEEAHA